MKYGIIYYKDTANLGDDILTYAGKQFLPQVDYYIDREALDLFVPEKREYVATIVNGFFLHFPFTFQMSPYILPYFIGIHFTKDAFIYHDYAYLGGYNKEYLKKYEPIGCRDYHTMKVLQEKEIKSYFSGCLTLTLQPFEGIKRNHKVILTDVSESIFQYVQKLLPEKVVERRTHRMGNSIIGQEWGVREKRVEEYLKLYQGADLVITTRLHCALPAVALGTPTILIGKYDEDYNNRLASFAEYVTTCSAEDIVSGKMDNFIQYPQIKDKHLQLVPHIKKNCTEFVDAVTAGRYEDTQLPKLSEYKNLYCDRVRFMRNSCFELISKNNFLLEQNQNLRAMLEP